MAEDRDVQSPPQAPVTRSTCEKQQKVPRPSKPDRPPRRLSSTKKTYVQQSTGSSFLQDPKNAAIMDPLQFQSTVSPLNHDQGASQPCARLRQLTTVDGGVALQRLYAIIQRQRDEWYQSNYTSPPHPTPTATPASQMVQQNMQIPQNFDQMDNNQGRPFVTTGDASGGTTGLASAGYAEPYRVTIPFTVSEALGQGRGSMKKDQFQTTKTLPSEVTSLSFRETQSVRFQTPLHSCEPLSLRPSGLVISEDDLQCNRNPLQEISGAAPYSTSLQSSGQNISEGTLESSTFQRPGRYTSEGTRQSSTIQGTDITEGTLQSSSFQRLRKDTPEGNQQINSFQRPGRALARETAQLGSFQQLREEAKGGTQTSNNLQQLGTEKLPSSTQPKSTEQSGITRSGVAAQHPTGTFFSNVLPQSVIQKSGTSARPQSFQKSGIVASGGSYGSLAQQSFPQRDLQKSVVDSQNSSLQQQATQPGKQKPLDYPPSGPSGIQAPEGSRPEERHYDMPGIPLPSNPEWSQQSTGVTSMQATIGSSQHTESPQSPGASGMQMSHKPSHQSPSSLFPAASGNQVPEGDSLRASEPAESKFEPRRRPIATANDSQTFEEQVSAEFRILKELASSLKNIRYLPTPVVPTVGHAFENCVLSEIRSIRSRCSAYSQSGIYSQPKFSLQGSGGSVATGPLCSSKALGPQGHGILESDQVSAFEQQVIAALRSISRSCEGDKNASVDQRLSSAVKDTTSDQSLSNPTRTFEELVLSKLDELEIEFRCQEGTQPVVFPAGTAIPPQPNPDDVLPTINPTSGTGGERVAQAQFASSTDPSQRDSTKPEQQSRQSNTTQDYRLSSGSGVGASSQPMEPSYIIASSKGTTPINRQIGSLTFDTTISTPARISRTERSGSIQNQVEPSKDSTTAEDKLRRSKFEAEVLQQSQATGQRATQAQGRVDHLPNPSNISRVENDVSFKKILEAPQNNSQMQETIYLQPTSAAQPIIRRGPVDRYDATTDECEAGSLEDSDSDLESIDSCSAQSLAFVHLPCNTRRDTGVKRQFNQTFLDCDYAYAASEMAPLPDRRPRQSMPAKLTSRQILGQGPSNVCAELTQYTMSETQPSRIPFVPDQQSICEPGSSYNRPKTSVRPTAKAPLSSTLKEGHVQQTRSALPPELPSTIETAPHRSSLPQENRFIGEYDAVLKNRSLEQNCDPNGPQRPLPLPTGVARDSSFGCSGTYYRGASNAPVVDSRYRKGSAFSGACDQVNQAAEESLCLDDEPHASLGSGFTANDRYDDDCMAESRFQRRPCTTSPERAGPSRGPFGKACSTPWPNRARPSGNRNKWPPLHTLDASCELSNGTRKTPVDSLNRCSGKRNKRPYGKTFSRPQPMDLRCGSRNAGHINTELNNRMMKCLGVAPTRSRYTHDPCSSSESESDCDL